MQVCSYTVNFGTKHEPILLVPFGDTQEGSPGFRKDVFNEFVEMYARNPRAYFIGMGDYCMSLDTEILTKQGFKKWNELKVGEDVLGYDVESNTCKWTPLLKVFIFENSETVSMEGKSFRAVCTPNHGWFVGGQHDSTVRKVTTKELKTNYRIKVSAKCDDVGEVYLTDEEAELIGWIVTDGNNRTSPRLNVSISQAKEPYRTNIRNRFNTWITGEYRFQGKNLEGSTFHLHTGKIRALYSKLGIEPSSLKDELPKLVTRLTPSSRKAMLGAMFEAEGWQERGKWAFSQKPGPVLDAFQILATLEGYRLGKPSLNSNGVYQVKVIRQTPVTVADLKIKMGQRQSTWCPRTKYGSWVCRYNGLISITGNSDCARPKMMGALEADLIKDGSVYEQLDNIIKADMRRLAKMFAPISDRVIGLLEGHHKWNFANRTTSTQYLCELLGPRVKYLDFAAAIRLRLEREQGHGYSVDVFATHGCGNGTAMSGNITKLEKIAASWDVDIVLRGHSTAIAVVPGPTLNKISHHSKEAPSFYQKNRLLVNTGGFMQSYVQGRITYPEEKNLSPNPLGWAEISIGLKSNSFQSHHPTISGRAIPYFD